MKPVSYITTLTSKGQFTVPKAVRRKLAVKSGTKFEVISVPGGFKARPQPVPDILKLAGSLKKYDDGRPVQEAIEEAKRLAAIEIANE